METQPRGLLKLDLKINITFSIYSDNLVSNIIYNIPIHLNSSIEIIQI